jgi:DNA-binding CsgD family transcriptional regulator
VPVTPSELAYHWVAARDIGHAVPALVEAGVAAERVYAFGEARRQFESALALWDQAVAIGAVGSPDRIAVMQRAAESAALSGAYDDAVAWGRAAITALEAQPAAADPIMAGRLHDRLRWFLWEAGDASAAEAEVEAALRLLPEAPPSALRARAEAQAAGLRLVAGDLEAAAALGRHALGVATQVGAEPEEALALGIVGWAEAALGDVDGGLERFRRGLAIAERLGGVEGIALGHANLAALLDRVGRTDESLAASMAGYDITRRLGVARTYGGILLGHASKALFDAGRWSEAIAISDTGLDLDPAARAAVLLHIHHARIDTNQGRFDAAADHLERAGTGGAAMDAATAARHLAATAELAMWRRRVADVRAATAEGRRLLRADRTIDPGLAWLAWFGLRAEADLAERSRPSRAGRPPSDAFVDLVLARLEADARSSETAEDARRRAIAGLCRAEIGRLNDEREPNRWADVGAAWSTIGRPALTAYARYREAAAILATRGVRRDAAALLQGAHGMALGLGATPLAEEVEILARHARIDLEAAPPSSVPDPARDLGLTEREQEVIALVAAGWTNQQIADALFITRKTASVHVSNLLGKLGAQNRSEAAAIAHRLGLDRAVPAPPD